MKARVRWRLAMLLLLFGACREVSRIEIARVPSPDGLLDAVLIETNGGATTSFGYEVHAVARGATPKRDGELAYLSGVDGIKVRWRSRTYLEVDHGPAKFARVNTPSWTVDGIRGTVVLKGPPARTTP